MSPCTEANTIRDARLSDIYEIGRIDSRYVPHTTISFETAPPSRSEA